ncbi:hypothetical protein ACFVIM_29845 [Streptomyces sp. NPDC057638]|uniref:hypothetical protein n=1 Tax=Streptomyces sp. NPDC057638 TaxID=3346190 RepID=UPI0036BF4E0A
MTSRIRRRVYAVVGGAAALAGISTFAFAANSAQPAAAPANELPPVAVEDFSYPGAAKILAEKNLKLLKGDGQIVFEECITGADQISVWTRQSATQKFCFRALGKSGYLTLEVPSVYAIQTTNNPVSAELTANGKTETVAVPKDQMKGVGEGVEGGAPAVLVEIRVTG